VQSLNKSFNPFFQIREEAILLKLKHVIKEQTDVLMEFKKLNPVDDKEEREVKLKRLRELKREEDQIRDLSDQELFDDIYEDYDWMKISAQCFDAAISPESCRYELQWGSEYRTSKYNDPPNNGPSGIQMVIFQILLKSGFQMFFSRWLPMMAFILKKPFENRTEIFLTSSLDRFLVKKIFSL
jgi:hypothetical protein